MLPLVGEFAISSDGYFYNNSIDKISIFISLLFSKNKTRDV